MPPVVNSAESPAPAARVKQGAHSLQMVERQRIELRHPLVGRSLPPGIGNYTLVVVVQEMHTSWWRMKAYTSACFYTNKGLFRHITRKERNGLGVQQAVGVVGISRERSRLPEARHHPCVPEALGNLGTLSPGDIAILRPATRPITPCPRLQATLKVFKAMISAV